MNAGKQDQTGGTAMSGEALAPVQKVLQVPEVRNEQHSQVQM